jgi:hypothetical protein
MTEHGSLFLVILVVIAEPAAEEQPVEEAPALCVPTATSSATGGAE